MPTGIEMKWRNYPVVRMEPIWGLPFEYHWYIEYKEMAIYTPICKLETM